MVIANVIAGMMFGVSTADPNMRDRVVIADVPAYALPLFAQSVLMPLVMAFVINILAGFFGGQRDYVQAVRTAAYAGTPAWLVGVFGPAWHQTEILRVFSDWGRWSQAAPASSLAIG